MSALVEDWRGFLDTLELTPDELEQARFRYDRPTIFAKRCARSLAARVRRGRRLVGGGRYAEAVECLESVVTDDPYTASYALELARYQRQAGEFDTADRNAANIAANEAAGRVMRASAVELRGDIAWSRGELDAAVGYYEAVSREPLSEDALRRVTVKLWASTDPAIAPAVYALFLATPPVPRDAVTLSLAEAESRTGSATLAYLLGLRLFEARDYERAERYLRDALARLQSAGEGTDRGHRAVVRRARLRLGQCLFFLERFEEARAVFDTLTTNTDPRIDGRAAEALDWMQRCDWSR